MRGVGIFAVCGERCLVGDELVTGMGLGEFFVLVLRGVFDREVVAGLDLCLDLSLGIGDGELSRVESDSSEWEARMCFRLVLALPRFSSSVVSPCIWCFLLSWSTPMLTIIGLCCSVESGVGNIRMASSSSELDSFEVEFWRVVNAFCGDSAIILISSVIVSSNLKLGF